MMLPENIEKRKKLLRWAAAGLAAVNPERRVAETLREWREEHTAVLAMGKAAAGMARGAEDALGRRIISACVIAPEEPAVALPDDWYFQRGDHPLPGDNSLAAGRKLRAWLSSLPAGMPLLVLLSGGASALVELPVAGLALSDLQRVGRWLLGSGLDIAHVNNIRARFSLLKRGGLLRLAGSRRVQGLLISDVPGDRIADIASGPLSPQAVEWPQAGLPDWMQALHASLPLPAQDKSVAQSAVESATKSTIEIVARNADALEAIAAAANRDGVPVRKCETLSGDAAAQGTAIARRIREGSAGIWLFGGETTVRLPEKPGQGGRNQHLALAAACEIASRENVLLLALATDGIDGSTDDAGALVDGGSVMRIRDAGLDADARLERADSNAALSAAGDVIHTGPTGTNVMDIVIAWKS